MSNIKKAKVITADKDYTLLIEFEDGEKRILDLTEYAHAKIFKPVLKDSKIFSSVKLDAFGGIEWDNGACLSPETIYIKSVPV